MVKGSCAKTYVLSIAGILFANKRFSNIIRPIGQLKCSKMTRDGNHTTRQKIFFFII